MVDPAPKIFISWSGDHAETVAGLVRDWLNKAYQRIDVFFSPDSIDKGDRPLATIEAELESSVAAIVVVTAQSMASPWVNYEVGRLSALRLADNRPRKVIPLLVGVDRITDVKGPLIQFQAVLLNRNDFKHMVSTLNRVQNMGQEWDDSIMEMTKKEIDAILSASAIPAPEKAPERPDRELLEEILVYVRNLGSSVIPSYHSTYGQSDTEKLRDLYGSIIETADVYPWDYDLNLEADGSLIIVLNDDVAEEKVRKIEESLEPLIESKIYLKGKRIRASERKEGTSTI